MDTKSYYKDLILIGILFIFFVVLFIGLKITDNSLGIMDNLVDALL